MAMAETMFDIRRERSDYGVLSALGAAFASGIAAFRDRRSERALMVELSRRSPRLLADMGLDAEAVYATLDGTWDEVDPARWRRDLPRASKI